MKKLTWLLLILTFQFCGCKSDLEEAWEFEPKQRQTADKIVSVFENNTTDLQYGFAKNINDGRGITAGRAGFTSATRDMYIVVKRYNEIAPESSICKYLPRLHDLAEAQSGSTEGLQGLEDAWSEAATDSRFRKIQDDMVNEWYYQPAVKKFNQLGLSFPVGLLLIYDAEIQHGSGFSPDGVPAMIQRTNEEMKGTPGTGVNEKDWLLKFQEIRRAVLIQPKNEATRTAWAASAPRVDTLTKILTDGNTDLEPEIIINPWGTRHNILTN